MINCCYRETLDFTFEKFASASRRLDDLRARVAELQNMQPKAKTQSSKVKTLTGRLISDFEEAMNSNLDVKAAFDKLQHTVTELLSLKEKMCVEDKKEVTVNLRRIDSVLQCLLD